MLIKPTARPFRSLVNDSLRAPEKGVRGPTEARASEELQRLKGVQIFLIPRHNDRFGECPRWMPRRSDWKGFLETVHSTVSIVIGCYMAEPAWIDDIDIEVVEAALSLPGLDQTPP